MKTSISSLSPTHPFPLSPDLTLHPRLSLLLTIHRSSSSLKSFNSWLFKHSLLLFLTPLLPNTTISEDDIIIHTFGDSKKRKREEAVASGILNVRELGFLNEKSKWEGIVGGEEGEGEGAGRRRFEEWREGFVRKVDGIDLNLEGVRFKLMARVKDGDDYCEVRKAWEEWYAFGNRGRSMKGGSQQPDTIILTGAPSRWFAEPRVSAKPSMLVTHTMFSIFGKIRKISVASYDEDRSKTIENVSGDFVSGLHCKIVIQFEEYNDFCNAMKALCGRSMQKQGSRLRADYEVIWDRDGFFRNTRQMSKRIPIQEQGSRWQTTIGHHRSDVPRLQPHASHFGSSNSHPKRFKD